MRFCYLGRFFNKKSLTIYLTFFLFSLLFPATIFAGVCDATGATGKSGIDIGKFVNLGGGVSIGEAFGNFGELATAVVRLGLFAAALIFFAMIIWGGFLFLNAGGDKENVEGARKTLTGAGIGLAIVVASFATIQIFYPIIGENQPSGAGSGTASTVGPTQSANGLRNFVLANASSTLDDGFLINFSGSAATEDLQFTAIYFSSTGKENAEKWLQENGCGDIAVELKSAAQAAAESAGANRD